MLIQKEIPWQIFKNPGAITIMTGFRWFVSGPMDTVILYINARHAEEKYRSGMATSDYR